MVEIRKEEARSSVLAPVEDEASIDVETNIAPTFNFAAYVSRSQTLQQLLKLGVNLYKIERKNGLMEYLLPLDFERDMKPHLLFLTNQVGVSPDCLGNMLTKNPTIFSQNLEDLQTRINYLESKRFTADEIRSIVERNPFWLMFSTKRIDTRLGFFQKEFQLKGNQIRQLAVIAPRLITGEMEAIRESTFSIREEMCLEKCEVQDLLLKQPRLWMSCKWLFRATSYERSLCILFLFFSACRADGALRLRFPTDENSERNDPAVAGYFAGENVQNQGAAWIFEIDRQSSVRPELRLIYFIRRDRQNWQWRVCYKRCQNFLTGLRKLSQDFIISALKPFFCVDNAIYWEKDWR